MIRNSTGLFSGHISGSALREGDLRQLRQADVKRVLIRRQQQVLLGKNSILEPLLLLGVDPGQEKEGTALSTKTVAGSYPASGEDTIFIGMATAKRLDLKVGDTLNVASPVGSPLKTLILAGIYKTGITALDQGLAFCPAEALPIGESELSAAVFLKAGVAAETIVAEYKRAMPNATFAAWPEFMPDLKQLIDLEYICMAIVIVLVFAIVAVGISCTFLIFTLKNLREHGIMKAMGFLPGDTALLLLVQIGMLTFAAAIFGALVGMLTVAAFAHIGIDISAFTSHNQYFAVSGMLYPRLTGPAFFAPPGVAMVFGLVAAIWPIVYINRKDPADILRSL
jgi:ABC-type lipoprotein release transport system permease subunit